MTIAQSARSDSRRWAALVVALLLPLAGVVAFPPAAVAATTMTSYVGFAYDSSSNNPPSADKPQSKLWFHAGHWWALMLTPDAANVGDVHIFQLQPDHTWRDTGVAVDSRANATGDALPDGDKLYVVSRQSGSDIRVARFGYDEATGTYAATGSPATITTKSAESATIAKDTLGRLWVTFTSGSTVWVMHTASGDESAWTAPFRPAVSDVAIDADDISAVVALPNAVGVMWSDQASSAFRFAVHRDGDADTVWSMETAMASPAIADDHISIKSLTAGDDGRVYAAVKTSLNDLPDAAPSDPQVFVLTRSGTGAWTTTVAGTVEDDMTRPVLVLDETNRQMYLFYTIDYLRNGKIYYKTSPVGATLRFASGQGTRAISYSGADINDASGSKDPVNSTTGMVVLASDERDRTYYHAEMDLPAPADTVAPSKPTVTVTPGPGSAEVRWTEATDNVAVAGYRVVRDGTVIWETTSGTTYTDAPVSAGSHTYAVTAFDGAGNTSTSATVTVTVPAPSGPAAPTGLTATATSPTSVGLTWNAPANTAGVVGYRVYRGSTLLASPTATSYTDNGAAAATTYTYAVASVDGSGQESARVTATVTTPAAPGGDIGVRAVSTTQSAGTKSLAIPTPAGVQAGDVVVAALETVSTPKVTPPSGWKLVEARRSSSTLKVFVYWRAAGSAEPASQVWKLSSAKPVAASVVAYTGVATAAAVEVVGSRYGSSTTKIATAPITTKTPRARVVAVYGIGTATTVTPPAALTERADLSATNGSTAVTLAVADYRQDTPGAVASLTAVAGAAARYASVVLALTPTG